MTKVDDLSRSLAALDQDSTLIAVIELSLKSWLVAGLVPGVERRPLKKLAAEPEAVRHLLERWRAEALKAGRRIKRVAVAFEAGRDGFWLARLQAELRRDIERLRLIRQQIKEIETERLERLERTPAAKPQAAMLLLQRIVGLGLETADTLTNEVLLRPLRDRRAVGRYGGITGAPDESGAKRREKGLARAGNARVRQTMIQLAWRWLMFQKDSALARWYRERTENASKLVRKKMIVALARKLLIALWRYVTDGVVPEGAVLRPAAA